MKEKELVESVKKDNNISSDITGILDIIICLLLFISSIYKGAFYKADFLFPNVAISLVGVVYLLYKIIKEIISKKDFKPKSKVRILLDGFILLLPVTYVLPIVFKTYASLPDSIYEMLRYVNMTIIYFIVRNTKNEQAYLNIFLLISFVQMILGIDQLTTRSFEEFLNDLSTGYLPDKQRLSGTLQYANITGIIIGIGVVYCFNKITDLLKKEGNIKCSKVYFDNEDVKKHFNGKFPEIVHELGESCFEESELTSIVIPSGAVNSTGCEYPKVRLSVLPERAAR